MSVLRRLYNVAKGKVLEHTNASPVDPSLADEPPKHRPVAEDEPEPVASQPDTVERPSGPRQRRL